MSNNALEMKITADVTQLQTKSAIAKAEYSAQEAALRKLAKTAVGASEEMKSALNAQMQQQMAVLNEAKSHWQSYESELKKATVTTSAAAAENRSAFDKLHESFRLTGDSIEHLHARLNVVSGAIGAFSELVMVGMGMEAVASTIERVVAAGDGLGKLAEETGLTTEQLSGLKVMATETDTDFESFTRLIQKLPSTMQQAVVNPTGTAAQAFDAMGIKVTDTTGHLRPMSDILDEVSAKLSSYQDGAAKTALETDIFGAKIGASLLPMLNQLGQVGLQGAIEKSNELHQTWTGPSAEAAAQYEHDMGRAKLAVEGITDALVRGLLPALDAVANAMAPTLNVQIARTQAELRGAESNHGRFRGSSPQVLQARLAGLEAQKKQLDDSMAQQKATVGGAAPGTVTAPAVSPASGSQWLQSQNAALDAQNAQIEKTATTTKQANAEKLQNTVQYWQGVLAAGNLNSQQELQAQTALSRAETALRATQLSTGTSAMKSATEARTQIAQEAASARKQIITSEYDAQVSSWNAEVALGKMSKAAEIRDEISAQAVIYQSNLAEMQKEAALANAGTAVKAKALDDIQVLTAQHNAELARMNTELVTQQIEDATKLADANKRAADASSKAWQTAFQPITQALDASVNGVIQGTQTMQQAEMKAAQSIALAFIDAEAKKLEAFTVSEIQILARTVMTQTGMTGATIAGESARLTAKTTAAATGKAADVALGTAQISSSAMKAAAGAYSAVAGIPYVGPVLAPVAAATAFAGVMAYDVLSASGGLEIGAGQNPLVQLHENETVLPAYIAKPLTSMLANHNTTNDASSGDTHVTNHFNLSGGGNRGTGMNEHEMFTMLNNGIRGGSLDRYPAIARMLRR